MDQEPDINTAAVDEDQEWQNALNDFSTEAGVKPTDPVVEDPAEPAEPAKPADPAAEPAPVETTTEDFSTSRSLRDNRALQRESLADETSMKADIKEQMFSDSSNVLKDADGDPINSIADVQKLVNPNTQAPFTEDEAAMWLLQAQQYANKEATATEAQIAEIADTNLSLRDQSDNVREKYGELLKSMPDLQKQVWGQFEQTLIKDEKTGIITKAPISLERFYDTALAGYVKLAEQLERQGEAEASNAKIKAENDRLQTRSDREDIYSTGSSDTATAEEKEWGAAAKAVFN